MDSEGMLRHSNMRPRKSLGQHFLISQDTLQAIAAAADLNFNDTVVEVGPGMGALTVVMAPKVKRIVAVELDKDLVAKLGQILAPYPNVHVVQSDILRLNLEPELASAAYKVVANLPYYITTPTLRYFFDQKRRPSLLVVTVQEEVARRMVAAPPDMNFLAVLLQFYGHTEIVRFIPAGAFYPPPKVNSAVVRLTPHQTPLLQPQREAGFLRLVSAGFSQRRKQLHNPLEQGLALPRQTIMAALQDSGIDEKRRAQTLSVEDWLRLYENVRRLTSAGT